MKTNVKVLMSWILFMMVALTACSPAVSERQFQDPKRNFTPRYEDIDVRERYAQPWDFNFNKIVVLDGDYSMAQTLRLAENLLALNELTGEEDLGRAGNRLLTKLHALEGVRQQVPIQQTPYAQLAIAQTENSVVSGLKTVDSQIRIGAQTVSEILESVGRHEKWPQGSQKMNLAATAIAGFIQKFADEIEKVDLYTPIKTALSAELANRKIWIQSLGDRLDQAAKEATRLADLILAINKLIQAEKIEIPVSLKQTLDQGQQIATGLESCDSAQGAMAVIVDVWTLLDEPQREVYFKPVSPELYKLLEGKSTKDLQCLKQPKCGGFLRELMKQYFILPKIEAYGVAKICTELNDQSLQFSIKTMEGMAAELFQQTPGLIQEAINEAIAEKQKQLAQIQGNYAGFFSEKIQTWSQKSLSGAGSVAALDSGSIKLTLKNREVRISTIPSSGASAESLGVGLVVDGLLLRQELAPSRSQQLGLEALNQLVALSGYHNRDNELIPALARPLDTGVPPLDIAHFAENPAAFAVTDLLPLQGFQLQTSVVPDVDLSAAGQAELLRGVSHMAGYFRDWNGTAYEKTLGLVTARDVIPEYDIQELNQSIFPKADLFALSVADAAVILKNMTKKFSQVFVVNLGNQITWVNDYDFKNGDAAVMAGVVDIHKGQRVNVVTSENVSRWILALSEFLQQTEGIENTKASQLLEMSASGTRPLDSLIEARRQLRLLLVGMCNFLSNQMIGADGLVVSSMSLADLKTDPKQLKSVLDQAMAIRALTRAAQVTKVSVYQVSAIEIYYKMNYHLYNPQIRFYSAGASSSVMPLPVAMEIVRSLTELRPYLPQISQRQLSWILQPWYDGLKTLY